MSLLVVDLLHDGLALSEWMEEVEVARLPFENLNRFHPDLDSLFPRSDMNDVTKSGETIVV